MTDPLAPTHVPIDDTALLNGESVQRGFDVVLRGYDRTQVDHHLDAVEALLSQCEMAAEAARAEAEALRRERDNAPPPAEPEDASFAALGRRVGRILTLAEEEATAIRDAARREVAASRLDAERLHEQTHERRQELLRGAEEDASRISRAAHDRAESQLEQARGEAEATVRAACQEADALLTAAREEVERLATERDAIRGQLDELRDRLMSLTGTTVQ